MKTKGLRGFTLLELLIAVTIFSIVAVAIYSSFNVGIRAWRKAENSYKVRQEARHALNTIGRELRCAINSTAIEMPFEGSSNYVSFCRTMKVPNPQGGYSEGIFEMTYTFEAEDKAVYYILQTYEERAKKETGTKSLLASDVLDFKLQYAYLDLDKVVWKDGWEELNIPLGVKVSLSYPSQSEGQVVEYSETFFIPTGTLKEATEGT